MFLDFVVAPSSSAISSTLTDYAGMIGSGLFTLVLVAAALAVGGLVVGSIKKWIVGAVASGLGKRRGGGRRRR